MVLESGFGKIGEGRSAVGKRNDRELRHKCQEITKKTLRWDIF